MLLQPDGLLLVWSVALTSTVATGLWYAVSSVLARFFRTYIPRRWLPIAWVGFFLGGLVHETTGLLPVLG